VDQEFRRWAEKRDADFREWTQERDREHREFLDALTQRHVGITEQLVAAITTLQAEIADQREQIQANTAALLRVLDRLEPGTG
jgi:hypothetical protein